MNPCFRLPAARMLFAVTVAVASAPIATAQESAPPAAAAAVPTKEAAREQTALKIAGLVTFVANSCPKLKPDFARFKTIIRSLGVGEERLAQPEFKGRYLAYTTAYQADAAASCERAAVQFGPKGSTLPDLFAAR